MTTHRRTLLALLAALALLATACSSAPDAAGGGADAVTGPSQTPVPTGSTSAPTAAPTATTPPTPTAPPVPTTTPAPTPTPAPVTVRTGADVLAADGFQPLAGLRVGLIANQTSRVGDRFLLDLLHEAANVDLAAVFAPEHGVRGTAGAGEDVGDTVDPQTGVPVISLYKAGSGFRPTPGELEGIDVLVYDLQDVGTRFYTYISTMGRCMEAAAGAGIPFVVLDRPNPSGGAIVEGFARTPDQASFISEYPIPARYGMTSGELARMIQGEGWKDITGLDLRVIPMQGWTRDMTWADTGVDWVPPSPGLPTADAAVVYPGTVLIEATTLSFGRGTLRPFTQIGAPWVDAAAVAADLNARGLPGAAFRATTFVPEVIPDVATDPAAIPFLGEVVHAVEIIPTDPATIESVALGLHVLDAFGDHATTVGRGDLIDRGPTFDLLAGTPVVRQMLNRGDQPADIVAAWAADVEAFGALRAPYLIH